MDIIGFFTRLAGGDLLLLKVIVATIVFALAGLQVFMAARFWGKSEVPGIAQDLAAKIHRLNGRVALPLATLVALTCLAGPAGPTSPTRVLLHSLFGTALFAVLATKFTILRVLRRGDRFVPYLGATVFLLFGGLWATSVFQYVTGGL